jgi:hypothetical protein
MSTRHAGPVNSTNRNDLLFLTVIVVVSVAPYFSRLGFYSDDWASLGTMITASKQSIAGLVSAQLGADPDGRARLTNTVYQAVLFRMFGLDPLGYHVVNALVLVSAALLLYLALCELAVQRTVAVSTAASYILLPNYSTDRFWFVAFGYGLSMALLVASTWAFLRAARSHRAVPWTVLALLALAAAELGMEVVIPLMLAIPGAISWQWYRFDREGLRRRLGTPRGLLLAVSPLIVTVGVAIYKSETARGFSNPDFLYLKRLVAGALAVNFGTYGVMLLDTVAWSVRHLPSSGAVLAGLLAVFVFSYLSRSDALPESRRLWMMLILAGCVVFGLGVAIFLTTARVLFWSAGIANRVWIAAALGVALVFVGASGWVSSRLPIGPGRWIFSGLITSLCVSGFIVNTAFSTYWIAAWPRQLEVLGHIRHALPEPPPRGTLILHGVCPYVGPAIVFESSWDLAGALRVLYRDGRLRADVTTGRFSIHDDGVRTTIYRDSQFYPYGPNLLLFDDRRGTVIELTDANVARAHLSENVRCPEGIAGRGTLMFPLDEWYRNALSKGFRPWR